VAVTFQRLRTANRFKSHRHPVKLPAPKVAVVHQPLDSPEALKGHRHPGQAAATQAGPQASSQSLEPSDASSDGEAVPDGEGVSVGWPPSGSSGM
jgi:hypothetical protein